MRPWEHRRWGLAAEAFADGELSPSLRGPMQAHLRECWWCSENIEVLRMMKASLRRQSARLAPMETARLRRFAVGITRVALTKGPRRR